MNEDDVRMFLHKKIKMPELCEAAFMARNKEFNYATFNEHVRNTTKPSPYKTAKTEDEAWREVMDFLVKRYGP